MSRIGGTDLPEYGSESGDATLLPVHPAASAPPHPRSALARRRAGWLVSCIGVAWLVIVARLVQLQVWQQDELADRATRQREFVEDIEPRPGDIFDRQGRLLATTVRARSLFVVPSHMAQPWSAAQQLADALELNGDELFERIGRHADKHFLWVKRRLTEEEADRVRALNLDAEWWGFRDEHRRVYPQGAVAAHVLGLRDIDGHGRGGIEESLETTLRGTPGQRVLTRDALGRVIDVQESAFGVRRSAFETQKPHRASNAEARTPKPPSDGDSVALTLDTVVQLFVERELDRLAAEWKPESCCAIVLDPHSGDVLAMASRPAFDPNHPESASADAWKNRAIADIYEPGSTIKPCIVAFGLDCGAVSIDDRFNCERGLYRMGRRLLHDVHPYGNLNLTDVLVKSSNIGMAKVGERLGNERLHRAVTAFGFGQRTGIELPGELPGILRPLSEWTSYSTGSIPMGHEIAVTPLQLIAGHAILANDGRWLRPRLVVRDQRSEVGGQQSELPTSDLRPLTSDFLPPQIVAADVAHWLLEAPMHEVVTRGTGRLAQIRGYEVFGKTGTAQCLAPNGGYRHGRYISSFLCGAPVQNPRALVLVVVNQASVGGEAFGGRVAAPAAAEILRQTLVYLRVSPAENAPPPQTARAPGRSRR